MKNSLPSWKAIFDQSMTFDLVAEAGFEPTTFGL